MVSFVSVCLLFKTDMVVCFHPTLVFQTEDHPLNAIPDEERNVKQFLLLCGMNQLMVEFCGIQWPDGEHKAKQTDGKEILAHRMLFDQIYLMSFIRCHQSSFILNTLLSLLLILSWMADAMFLMNSFSGITESSVDWASSISPISRKNSAFITLSSMR